MRSQDRRRAACRVCERSAKWRDRHQGAGRSGRTLAGSSPAARSAASPSDSGSGSGASLSGPSIDWSGLMATGASERLRLSSGEATRADRDRSVSTGRGASSAGGGLGASCGSMATPHGFRRRSPSPSLADTSVPAVTAASRLRPTSPLATALGGLTGGKAAAGAGGIAAAISVWRREAAASATGRRSATWTIPAVPAGETFDKDIASPIRQGPGCPSRPPLPPSTPAICAEAVNASLTTGNRRAGWLRRKPRGDRGRTSRRHR